MSCLRPFEHGSYLGHQTRCPWSNGSEGSTDHAIFVRAARRQAARGLTLYPQDALDGPGLPGPDQGLGQPSKHRSRPHSAAIKPCRIIDTSNRNVF